MRLTGSEPSSPLLPPMAKEEERKADDEDKPGKHFHPPELPLSPSAAVLATVEQPVRAMPKPSVDYVPGDDGTLAAVLGSARPGIMSPLLSSHPPDSDRRLTPPAYYSDTFVPSPRDIPAAKPTTSPTTTSTELFSSLPYFSVDANSLSFEAGDRSYQLQKENCTHGTGCSSTVDLGKAAERCLAEGTASRGFHKRETVLLENNEGETGTKDLESDVSDVKMVKRQRLASSQLRDITPRLNVFLNVVKFIIRMKAGIKYRLTRKHYSTHGSATKGSMRRYVSEMMKLVGRQRFDGNAGSSTLAEEDSINRRNQYLDSKEKAEKQHCDTFHEDVKAWIDIMKLYDRGPSSSYKCATGCPCTPGQK